MYMSAVICLYNHVVTNIVNILRKLFKNKQKQNKNKSSLLLHRNSSM